MAAIEKQNLLLFKVDFEKAFDSVNSNFLMDVKWKTVLLDPKFGGLGVGFLHAKNLGLLGKWKWRFLTEEKALWNIVIKEFYGGGGGFNSPSNQIGSGGIWSKIIKAVKCIEDIDTSFKDSFGTKC
ncbi:hypothetical protein Tco_0895614 [Tanacetum coccineum]|uniref:RNA-directed DNA polymerase, eukaryota, reverse transcriptase zinc-binding domain protein n=1 Tax=Tanacetum coccineum TaxID=301880 RepID=A0ABQ5CHA6_9ASTR